MCFVFILFLAPLRPEPLLLLLFLDVYKLPKKCDDKEIPVFCLFLKMGIRWGEEKMEKKKKAIAFFGHACFNVTTFAI